MEGDGVIGGKESSKSSASDYDDSSKDTGSGPGQDTTKTGKANSVKIKGPPIDVVMDTNVNTVVSALDKDAAIPRPTTATIPMRDAAIPRLTTTKIPTNAALTQSPLGAPIASVRGDNGSSKSDSDLSLPVDDMISNKI
jgi:hypothetical protein